MVGGEASGLAAELLELLEQPPPADRRKAANVTAPINFKMASHPMNWITFLLMVFIAGSIGHLVLTYLGIEPSTKKTSSYDDMPAGQSPGQVASGAIDPQGSMQDSIY
jgi:hypothetical protein